MSFTWNIFASAPLSYSLHSTWFNAKYSLVTLHCHRCQIDKQDSTRTECNTIIKIRSLSPSSINTTSPHHLYPLSDGWLFTSSTREASSSREEAAGFTTSHKTPSSHYVFMSAPWLVESNQHLLRIFSWIQLYHKVKWWQMVCSITCQIFFESSCSYPHFYSALECLEMCI